MFTPSQQLVYIRTYSRWNDSLNRRETWEETVDRYVDFIKQERGDKIPEKVIKKIRAYILSLGVMPSMRALWAAGDAARKDNVCMYNCAFQAVDSVRAFSECLYILMCGTGYGFSVEEKHIKKLPVVQKMTAQGAGVFVIEDSKEGWADSVKELMENLYEGKDLDFDYSKLRKKGARLKTMGGRSSGPEPLITLHHYIRSVMAGAQGRKLTDVECHDIMCQIAEIVVVGGVRRSSEISLSDLNSNEMRNAKTGNFPLRRYMANNSAVYTEKPSAIEFLNEWAALANSGSGERGIFNLGSIIKTSPARRKGDLIAGTNPCKPLKSTILTENGYVTFEQALEMDSLRIITPSGKIVNATKPFKTGEQKQVWQIKLSNGNYLYGTDNHLHMLRDGRWVEVKDLKVGDRLSFCEKEVFNLDEMLSDRTEYNVSREKAGMVAGWVHGDGWLRKRSDFEKGHTLGMCFGSNEMDVVDFFEKELGVKTKAHEQKPDTCVYFSSHRSDLANMLFDEGYDLNKNKLEWLYLKDPFFKLGFLKALFTADGSVRKKNNVELYSVRRESLEVVSNVLKEFGIYNTIQIHGNEKSYIAKDGKERNNKTCWKINVYAGQFKKIGFMSKFKNDLLKDQTEKEIYRYKDYATVVDIVPNHSVEDVYDITVDDDSHAFFDSGIVTHNCGEITLRSMEFCNLSEVVIRAADDLDDLMDKVECATWIGVIQSTFTKFPYLRSKWKQNCEEERLLGVSLTGQMDNPQIMTPDNLKALKKKALKVAEKAAKIMGVNFSVAITTGKPSGTVSQLVDCASGCHTRFSPYYIRRYRISSTDPLCKMLKDQNVPMSPEVGQRRFEKDRSGSIVEVKDWSEDKVSTWVIDFPISSPKSSVTRHDMDAIQQLEHYKMVQKNWCEHNQSVTIYVKDSEWFDVGNWVYNNWDFINGVSFLPYDGGIYELAPYEEITKEQYEELLAKFPNIDYSQLYKYEVEDNTQGSQSFACVGDKCELK